MKGNLTPHRTSLKEGSFGSVERRPVSGTLQTCTVSSHKKESVQLVLGKTLDVTPRRGPDSGKARDLDRAVHLLHNTSARRFWKKVNKLNGTNACWVWTSALNRQGYGQFWMGALKRNLPAHRLSYVLTFGSIGNGLLVCHKCDNPICVRPDHLFVGTVSDNQRDRVAKGRMRVRRSA